MASKARAEAARGTCSEEEVGDPQVQDHTPRQSRNLPKTRHWYTAEAGCPKGGAGTFTGSRAYRPSLRLRLVREPDP